jgi:hypothetical protein
LVLVGGTTANDTKHYHIVVGYEQVGLFSIYT